MVNSRNIQDKVTTAEMENLIMLKETETEQKKLHGLENQGATCYLNSILQVLFVTSEIHDRFDTGRSTDRELRNLFKRLEKNTCGTEKITKTLRIQNVSQQRDAADCLEQILRKVSPKVSEIFEGQLKYTTKCCKGHIINEEANPFWTLPLPLINNSNEPYSVERGFKEIFQTKSYSGDNMVYCNDCQKKRKAISVCKMLKFPSILILLLKRFDFDNNTMSDFKSNCCVTVPSALKTKDKIYTVYGIVNHMGSLRGGHYTATVLSTGNNTWFDCDDSHVTKAEKYPSPKTGPHKSRTAYLLMYRASEKREGQQSEPMGSDIVRKHRTGGEICSVEERTGGTNTINLNDSQCSTDRRCNNVFIVVIAFWGALFLMFIIVFTILNMYR